MELRVWTGNVERVILDADDDTTSSDVIFTLAVITKISGSYTLIGQLVDTHSEFILSPSDKPVQLLKRRRELGQSSVRFFLRHSRRTQQIKESTYRGERTRAKPPNISSDDLYNRLCNKAYNGGDVLQYGSSKRRSEAWRRRWYTFIGIRVERRTKVIGRDRSKLVQRSGVLSNRTKREARGQIGKERVSFAQDERDKSGDIPPSIVRSCNVEIDNPNIDHNNNYKILRSITPSPQPQMPPQIQTPIPSPRTRPPNTPPPGTPATISASPPAIITPIKTRPPAPTLQARSPKSPDPTTVNKSNANNVELLLCITEENTFGKNVPEHSRSPVGDIYLVGKNQAENRSRIDNRSTLNNRERNDKDIRTELDDRIVEVANDKAAKDLEQSSRQFSNSYVDDSLEKIAAENRSLSENYELDEELQDEVSGRNKTLKNKGKVRTVSTTRPPLSSSSASQQSNLTKNYMDVIESLDDYLDQEIRRPALSTKKIPKKITNPGLKFSTNKEGTEEDDGLTYRQKLDRFRRIEKGKSPSEETQKLVRPKSTKDTGVEFGRIQVNALQYAEHVDSEIKDLKLEVERNEIAAKNLENSIKQMQTELEDFYKPMSHRITTKNSVQTPTIISAKPDKLKEISEDNELDRFYYPAENFVTTLDSAQIINNKSNNKITESDIKELVDNVYFSQTAEAKDNDPADKQTIKEDNFESKDSLNKEFLDLLSDNRQGYLV